MMHISRSSISVSSSREGSQERKIENIPVRTERPPLIRRPSWRRQNNVLQKARKFEARQIPEQHNSTSNR